MANHTILLIDYEPRSIERFRQPLTGAGYRVEIATDGIAGVEAFTRLSPDMVLVEAMIPKKHGFEVCQELKRTPHGRRTPIIITTGVYKGRKYRTQALHIYGCDEYIEKPIAAEQLLAIVERFLGNTTPVSREPVAATVDASETSALSSTDTPRSAPESSPGRPTGHKPGPVPKAMVSDLTEDEIMARLDAILPGSMSSPSDSIPQPVLESAPEPPAVEIATEPEAPPVEADPFLQMQAELTAELGSLNTALALEPVSILEPVPDPISDSIPSDQAATPPLLESLPSPERVAPEVPETIPLDLSAGQVVSFDVKRSRKNKKGRKHAAASSGTPAGAPIDSPTLSRTPAPTRASREMGIPSGTLVESALSRESSSSRGIPAWAWILVGAIALVAVYFVFWSGTLPIGRTAVESREAPRAAQASPPEPVAAPEETASVASPSPDSHLVLNAVSPQPARTAPAPVETAPKPATKPADTIKPPPARRPSTPQSPSTRQAELQAPPSALDLGTADAGVETIAAPVEAPAPRATTARGALVDIAEVDSPPASLSRKLPAYSMQARQMRLQGTVVLKVLVNEVGAVEQVVVVSGIDGAGLNDAAVKAARQWTYRPATKDGVPVKVWTTEQVTFKIY